MHVYQPEEERESRRTYYRPVPRYLQITPNMFAAAFGCIGMAAVLLVVLACANHWWGLSWK